MLLRLRPASVRTGAYPPLSILKERIQLRILPINVRKQRTISLAAVIIAAGVTIIFALALSASAQSEPWRAAVTGVSVVAGDNPGELVISWDAHPENPNDYRVKWAEEDGDFRPYGNSDWNAYPTGTTHTVTGLTPGDTYKARVLARFDDRKRSVWSAVVTGAAAIDPTRAAVTGLSVEPGDSAGDLVISWDAHPAGPNDYRVKWAEEDGEFRPYGNSDWNAYPTSATHTVTGLTPGATYKATVLARFDDRKRSVWSAVVTGSAALPPPNLSAAGQPVITGTVEVDETLGVDTSGITDENGMTDAEFSYQWVRSAEDADADIAGETGSEYTLTEDDAGYAFKVRVSFTDDDGYAESVTSDATDLLLVSETQESETDMACEYTCLDWVRLRNGGFSTLYAIDYEGGVTTRSLKIRGTRNGTGDRLERVTVQPIAVHPGRVTVTITPVDADREVLEENGEVVTVEEDGHQLKLPKRGFPDAGDTDGSFNDGNANQLTITVSDDREGSTESTTYTFGVFRIPRIVPHFPDATTRSVLENGNTGRRVGARVSAMPALAKPAEATDTINYPLDLPEDPSTSDWEYTLGGADSGHFRIAYLTGQLSTRRQLDYEARKSYTVTVTVTDDSGRSDTTTVNINVVNEDEEGEVSISPWRPSVGAEARASLTDPDRGIANPTWEWSTCDRIVSGTCSSVVGDAETYTPVAGDVGKFLKAVASYDDGHGDGKTAEWVALNSVSAQ